MNLLDSGVLCVVRHAAIDSWCINPYANNLIVATAPYTCHMMSSEGHTECYVRGHGFTDNEEPTVPTDPNNCGKIAMLCFCWRFLESNCTLVSFSPLLCSVFQELWSMHQSSVRAMW